MREGDQLETAVEDAEHLVLLEVDHVDVAVDLGIVRGVPEAQVTGALVERAEVRRDAVAMARAERANRYPRPTSTRGAGVAAGVRDVGRLGGLGDGKDAHGGLGFTPV